MSDKKKQAHQESRDLAVEALREIDPMTDAEWNRMSQALTEPTPVRTMPWRTGAWLAVAAAVLLIIYMVLPARPNNHNLTDAGVIASATSPLLPEQYQLRMATSDPKVKIIWVFDRNLQL